mgnify:CR=1 FL=1
MDDSQAPIEHETADGAPVERPVVEPSEIPQSPEADGPGGFEDRVSTLALQLILLTHGSVIGGALDNVVLGLFIGLVASVLLDLCMGAQSLVLALMRYASGKVCSTVTSLAHAIARGISRKGVSATSSLADVRCGFSR